MLCSVDPIQGGAVFREKEITVHVRERGRDMADDVQIAHEPVEEDLI